MDIATSERVSAVISAFLLTTLNFASRILFLKFANFSPFALAVVSNCNFSYAEVKMSCFESSIYWNMY